MTTVSFYPLDITYRVVNDATHTYIFGRSTDDKQICVVDTKTQPHFYIVPQSSTAINTIVSRLKGLKVERRGKTLAVKTTEVVSGIYKGKKQEVIKTTVNRPTALAGLKEEVRKFESVAAVLEADIPFKRKYWIDQQITPMTLLTAEGEQVNERLDIPVIRASKIEKEDTSLERPKILAFDIETYNPLGKTILPEKFPIVMISFYGEGLRKVITWKRFKTDKEYIEFVDGEAELLERSKEVIEDYAPDCIAGYYSDGFDFPYILKRAEKYKTKLDIGLDNSAPKLRKKGRTAVETVGIVHIDVLNFVKQIAGSIEAESLKLDDVSEAILGERKKEVDISRLAEVWDKGGDELEMYCAYNLRDSELTYRLLLELLPNITELMKLIGQPPQALERMGYGHLVEWYLMKRSKEFGQLIPDRPTHREVEKRMHTRVKGAAVHEPTPGLYRDLYVYDFRSLYPTIMITHNISPETINCNCCIDKGDAPVQGQRMWFCKKRKGFFPAILEDVLTRKSRITSIMRSVSDEKKILLCARQKSLKILSNSFYGYLGFFGSRWYSKRCVEAVTAYGRQYIQKVIDKAKEAGLSVVYSDTDSIFLDGRGKKKEELEKFSEAVNFSLPDMMELEFEGEYKTGLFVSSKDHGGAKKKYALRGKRGRVTIRGFESVRRNWSFVARDIQEKVIRYVLREKTDTALEYVKRQIELLRKNKLPVGQVVIQTQMTKNIADYEAVGPHVAVAKLMQARGEDVKPGSMIRYVIVEGPGLLRDKARLPEDAGKEDYDSEYYIHHQIIPAVEKIFEVFGIGKEDLLEEKEQSKLDKFFE